MNEQTPKHVPVEGGVLEHKAHVGPPPPSKAEDPDYQDRLLARLKLAALTGKIVVQRTSQKGTDTRTG